MCGIAGFTGKPNPTLLENIAAKIAHRGPDGRGIYRCDENGVNLAHTRLSILDLAGGHQPMLNMSKTLCIVFNGEIYNHACLRQELINLGYKFQSDHSDTEVLIHGYEEWGSDLPQRLNGMFAFCIYDQRKRQFFFARDRFGKKPLYYAMIKSGIAFASELKALALHPEVSNTIDDSALRKYFAYGYIPAPYSLYKGTQKLPGGYQMVFDLDSRNIIEKKQYYKFEVNPDESLLNVNEGTLCEELRDLLQKATERRLVADRPVGVFLSGGIDSSAILSCAAKAKSIGKLNSFAIGFSEESYDESNYAQIVADQFGSNHHTKIFDIEAARDIANKVMANLDEPMADSSILPTYLLANYAAKHITVALGGDGGDELFAGYAPFRALAPAKGYYDIVPKSMKSVVRSLVNCLPTSHGYLSLDFKVKRTLRGLEYPPSVWNPVWLSPLEPKEISELLEQPFSWEDVYSDAITAWESSKAKDLVGKTTEFYTRFYLQDGILTKVDRATMMSGLEARSPFLDNDLVAFAAKLPSKLKQNKAQGKYILRQAMSGILPESILKRPKKGFGIPLTAWLKDWKFPEPSSKFGYNQMTLDNHIKNHQNGVCDERLFLWSWIVIQNYLQASKEMNC